jgi:hypothetical protein
MRFRWRRLRRASGSELTCRDAVAGAGARRDQELLEGHLDDCPDCSEHLKQIEATILVSGEVRAEDLDPLAREDLMDIYRRWRAEGGGT